MINSESHTRLCHFTDKDQFYVLLVTQFKLQADTGKMIHTLKAIAEDTAK